MPKILLAPCVTEELFEIWHFIARDNLQAANRLMRAAEKTFRSLANNPALGRPRKFRNPRLRDVCTWTITGYRNYLIFFRLQPDTVEVLHVFHAARDIDRLLEGD